MNVAGDVIIGGAVEATEEGRVMETGGRTMGMEGKGRRWKRREERKGRKEGEKRGKG